MIVRITEVATIRQLTLQPGDEIHVAVLPPELKQLVESERIDGVHVAEIVGEDEYAVVNASEAAVTRGRRRATV